MADAVDWLCGEVAAGSPDPFLKLAKQFPHESTGEPYFTGGWAGLFGYGCGQYVEKLPTPAINDLPTPDYALGEYRWAIVWDHQENTATLHHRTGAATVRQIERWLETPHRARSARPRPAPGFPLENHPGFTSNFTRAAFTEAIAQGVAYTHAGDCFQVNLAQRLTHSAYLPPEILYERLRQKNPAPFAAYFDLGEATLLSSSPERFLKLHGRVVETRPIKGTRPRGVTPELDQVQIHDLLTNPKDRAENVMIVDLLRNDLGRSCEFGSVRVPKVCELETFETVHHMVSEVIGTLKADVTPAELLRQAFPGGSVTGAPKVRSMEIISELERTARGPYCGSLAYFGYNGSMDSNILIRTVTATQGVWQFPVGGGIVADSIPTREYEETLHKAAGIIRAIV
jgi:para-aminobenzoate synthetase component I